MKSKLAGVGASKAVMGASLALLLCASGARAGAIPYPDIGTPIQGNYAFTASATGDIIAYFVGSTAGTGAVYDLGLRVNGTLTPQGFGLATCPACPTPPPIPFTPATLGQSFDLGHANAGDALTFVMRWNGVDSVPPAISSNLDADGTLHVYSTPYTATSQINVGNGPIAIGSIPAGTFVSFEDQPFPGAAININYNDFDFVVTNVSVSVPGPIAGAGLPGLIAACGALLALARRRRRLKQAPL